MKLIAKTPGERYQTAAGVGRGLRRLLADSESRPAKRTQVQQFDSSTVLELLQVMSVESSLVALTTALIRFGVEHTGADRGLLILHDGDAFRIAAEAGVSGDAVTATPRQSDATADQLPLSMLHHVHRTGETVLLHDASTENPFSSDEYLHQHRARSVLCMPLVQHSRPVGLMYLENDLAPGVFTPSRVDLLTLLSSAAAISLENARLYRELEAREARVRRLVDSNITPIAIWHADGRILDVNEAFLRTIGYDRDDVLSGRIRWSDLTPPEWHERGARALDGVKEAGTGHAAEREYLHEDGTRMSVLAAGAVLEESPDERVAFALDLTRSELANVARVASIGALTASIAHEVNQPLAGIITNASTCVRMLDADPPNVEGARETARRTVRDGNRAADVITRLRAMFTKREPTLEPLDLNQAIEEVVALSLGDLQRGRVALHTELADDLPSVMGDRVQLQQVVLNLLRNSADAMSEVSDRARDLTIKTEFDDEGHVRVIVRDSGMGIDPRSSDKLFEAFHTTKSGGMGIGLSVSRSIVERHHGRLWVEPTEGPGATFALSIPCNPVTATEVGSTAGHS